MVGEQQRLFKTKKIIMKQKCECIYECLGYLTKECKRIEEPKIETLEEAVELFFRKKDAKNCTLYKAAKFGAKWEQERSYSEEDMKKAFEFYAERAICDIKYLDDDFTEFIKQFKKK